MIQTRALVDALRRRLRRIKLPGWQPNPGDRLPLAKATRLPYILPAVALLVLLLPFAMVLARTGEPQSPMPGAPAIGLAGSASPSATAAGVVPSPTTSAASPTPSATQPSSTLPPSPAAARSGPVLTARGTQARIGLQAGHWRNSEAPAPFNGNSGTSGGGKVEWEVNLDIAQRTAEVLRQRGVLVDVLPTWFNNGYTADAFLAIHCDGGPADRRGFYAQPPGRTQIPESEKRLADLLNLAHGAVTGIPYKPLATANARFYYGFDRVNPNTPRSLIEMGFLTNEADRGIILGKADDIAKALAEALITFVREQR